MRWLHLAAICFGVLSTVACFGVSAHVLHHLPSKAGEAAEEFARVAFIENDTATAYSLMAEEFRVEYNQSQFESAVRQMHPKGRPTAVSAE